MKYLELLHQLKIFRKKDLEAFIKETNATKEILRRYRKQGLISQVRRNLYVVTDLATKSSLAGKFEIAGQITSSSTLSYHAALEYHGLAHQIFYTLPICSKEVFHNFDYEGITYMYYPLKSDEGIVTPNTDSFVRVTDLERTIIDCIDRIDLSGGIEELVHCLAIITYVDENKLLKYLDAYHKQFLYQKTGFILSYFQNEMRLSDSFFDFCKSFFGKSTRYLTYNSESDTYFKQWKLCAPQNILSFLEQGQKEHV
ncbi:MAG: hypothetical protein LBC84_05385 [Prevotellaceae bacterium]|jgi:predicted transcriptional regulator of viral defense system|nr:hypothetical protein [Prevotellaceae bacterium]